MKIFFIRFFLLVVMALVAILFFNKINNENSNADIFGISSKINNKAQSLSDFEQVVIKTKLGKEHIFKAVIADTPAKESKGLMFVKHLDINKAMLFEMGKSDITKFWMKNTFIPLDIIFIGSKGEIKKIEQNAEPLSLSVISSDVAVKAVLEINGGLTKKLGISKGDKIIHSYFK